MRLIIAITCEENDEFGKYYKIIITERFLGFFLIVAELNSYP